MSEQARSAATDVPAGDRSAGSGSPEWDEERLARAALTAVCEAADPRLVEQVHDQGPVAVWETIRRTDVGRWSRRAREVEPELLVDQAEGNRVRFVVPGDAEWPEQLEVLDGVQVAGLGGAPLGLWLRGPGRLDQWCERSVAVVGSRASTPYGDRVATDLAIDLAGHGWGVVSGGAYGIDGCAHRGAHAAQGRTVAVLAGGLDEPYPRGNRLLFDMLAQDHLLASEVPCGMHPTRVAFLARNRLIAALSVGTVLVEAAARSGANNTASWASECGRVVMAVPGPVHSAMSVTPHRLVRDGRASLVTGCREVLALVAPLSEAPVLPVGGGDRLLDGVPPDLVRVREVLPGRGGMPTGEVARRVGLTLPGALAALGRLQELGLVRRDEEGLWQLARPR